MLRGVGLGLRAEIAGDLVRDPTSVDFVEVVAESCYVSQAATREAEALRELLPVVPHGVKLSLGSAEGIDVERARRLGALARRLRAPLVSEHVSFVRAGGLELGHLTPLPRTREAVDVVARNTAVARRALGDVPLLLENVATTFRHVEREAREGDFYAEIAEQTGCSLLFDVANLYANALNAGLDPVLEARAFPHERIAMIHVAGGVFEDGYYLDDHAHAVPEAVLEMLADALSRAGDVPVLIERDAAFPPFGELLGEVDRVRAARAVGGDVTPRARGEVPVGARPLRVTEEALARAFVGGDASNELGLAPGDVSRTRAILTRKRADEALPLLPAVVAHPEARQLALQIVEQTPRPAALAGVVDAVRIARRALEVPALRLAASRDLLSLEARFAGEPGAASFGPRRGPYVARRVVGRETLYAVKPPGAAARLRLFAVRR